MDRKAIEQAILALGKDRALLARFKAAPAEVGPEVGLDSEWSAVVASGNRDRLRSHGLPDGITILNADRVGRIKCLRERQVTYRLDRD